MKYFVMRTRTFRGLALSALLPLLLVWTACNRSTTTTGPGGTGGEGEAPSPIKEAMGRLTKGPDSLTPVIGRELNEDSPPWDTLKTQTKEYSQLVATLGKYDPPKGSKESWDKQTTSYAEKATSLELAVQHKDKDAALAAHKEITQSCRACHDAHRPKDSSGNGLPPLPGGFSLGGLFAKQLMKKLDTDKDSKLSREEMRAGVKQLFKDCDKDNKGSISQEALAEGINRVIPAPAPPPGMPAGAGAPPPPARPAAARGLGMFAAMNAFKRADTNNDSKVTQAELVAAADKIFDEVDKEKSGKLDEQGVAAMINVLLPPPPMPQGGAGGPGMPFPPPPPGK